MVFPCPFAHVSPRLFCRVRDNGDAMLSKDAVSDIFNTMRRRIHWLSWMNLGIAGLYGVLAYRPELRGM